jgi:hypothetical protein
VNKARNGVRVIALVDYCEFVDPKDVFRGLTYGQWVAVWYNNLLSVDPDVVYRGGNGMAFLRGNVQYQRTEYQKGVDVKQEAFYSSVNELRITIQKDMAVFVPVITSQFLIGDEYQGVVLNDELALRAAARRDTVNGGEIAARIKKFGSDDMTPLVPNRDLNDFYFETPLFPVTVPKGSTYIGTRGTTIAPGVYYALVAGIFVILVKFQEGLYRIAFSGRGIGNYLTKSEYDISVYADRAILQDVSGGPRPEASGPIGKKEYVDPLDFVGKWKDKGSDK